VSLHIFNPEYNLHKPSQIIATLKTLMRQGLFKHGGKHAGFWIAGPFHHVGSAQPRNGSCSLITQCNLLIYLVYYGNPIHIIGDKVFPLICQINQ
jgi:hypothetical protein